MIFAFDADLDAADPAVRGRRVHVVHAVAERDGPSTGRASGARATTPARVWRRAIVINVIGATATGLVLIVVTVSKFTARRLALDAVHGASSSLTFLTIHRHYLVVMRQLRRNAVRPGELGVNHMVLVVRDLDAATAEALGAIRSIRPGELRVVHPVEEPDGDVPYDLQERWRAFSGGIARLEPLPVGTESLLDALRGYVARVDRTPEDFVNVVIPEMVQPSLLRYLVGAVPARSAEGRPAAGAQHRGDRRPHRRLARTSRPRGRSGR